MPIRVLPPAVAAGIAAGEVVERPASVVKELIENSLDAGARTVAVDILQGGLQSIRVTDDGSGIPEGEVELAFHRHATSKLATVEELSHITTLGFRGEALASVAAAAHVRMTTRTADSDAAAYVEIEGTEVLRKGRESAAYGTTVEVDALFSTIPARLKFVRSPAAETARIHQVVDHLAMAHPEVRFSLRVERRTLVQFSGNGLLRDVLAVVHGTELASVMLDVAGSERAPYPLHGLISPPEHSRPNRTGISLFVNDRSVTSGSLSAAVQEAYRGLLMEGRFPFAALFIDVPPNEVDVNVHPNKREVRFWHDGDAFSSIERSVRETLLAADPVVEARGLWSGPPPQMDARSQSAFSFTMAQGTGTWTPLPEPTPTSADDGDALLAEQATALTPAPAGASEVIPGPSPLRVLGQIASTYIVAEGPDGMYLIDQHAAHESVLYYRLLRQWEEHSPETQPMLEPLPLDLAPEQLEAAPGAQEVLARYGVVLEPFGEATWLLRAVPAVARRVNGAKLVAEVLTASAHNPSRTPSSAGLPDFHLTVAASIACHSAIRAGQSLDQQEMEALGNALVTEANPQHCPHGRPTTIRVTTGMLEREFGRA